jgi:hypothetical protein
MVVANKEEKTAEEAHAYTPGLKIKRSLTLRKSRELPIPGKVLVKEGDTVDFDTIVAEMEMPGEPHIVKANLLLRVDAKEIGQHMLKGVGDEVEEGEVIAQYFALFGLIKRYVYSPIDGKIDSIGASGWVTVRTPPIIVDLKAYIPGKVIEVIPEKGVVIETTASFIQGIFGIGGETHGTIHVLVDSPEDVLTADLIMPKDEGAVIVGGCYITLEALRRAVEVGVAGIVVGGFDGDDLTKFLGYEMGIAITGEEEIGLTLVITEGFGRINMSPRTFELLKQFDGSNVSINGETQIRAGVIRPEVIIPHGEMRDGIGDDELSSGMKTGTPIRIIRHPYFGLLGKVSSLPVELQVTETESSMRVLEVELEDGRKVIVPRANVEIIEI